MPSSPSDGLLEAKTTIRHSQSCVCKSNTQLAVLWVFLVKSFTKQRPASFVKELRVRKNLSSDLTNLYWSLFYKLNILLENTEVSVGFNEQELEQMTIYEIYFQNVIYQCHIKYVRTAATKKLCA